MPTHLLQKEASSAASNSFVEHPAMNYVSLIFTYPADVTSINMNTRSSPLEALKRLPRPLLVGTLV
jgi:hypothetical protein